MRNFFTFFIRNTFKSKLKCEFPHFWTICFDNEHQNGKFSRNCQFNLRKLFRSNWVVTRDTFKRIEIHLQMVECNDSDSDYTYNNIFFPFASILFSRFVYLLRSMKFHSTAALERVSIKQQRTETRKKEIWRNTCINRNHI